MLVLLFDHTGYWIKGMHFYWFLTNTTRKIARRILLTPIHGLRTKARDIGQYQFMLAVQELHAGRVFRFSTHTHQSTPLWFEIGLTFFLRLSMVPLSRWFSVAHTIKTLFSYSVWCLASLYRGHRSTKRFVSIWRAIAVSLHPSGSLWFYIEWP